MNTKRFGMEVYTTIILRKDQQVLIMKRNINLTLGGYYAFPGGGVDGSEPISNAAVREAYEELGVIINPEDLSFVHVTHVKTEHNTEYINFFFQTSVWQGTPSIMEPDKCDELIWCNVHELPAMLAQSHAVALLHTDNRQITEIGW